MLTTAEWLGSVGVGLLLIAYVLDLKQIASSDRPLGATMNMVGAGLACASAWVIGFMPFVVLEGTWSLVAMATLVGLGWKKMRS